MNKKSGSIILKVILSSLFVFLLFTAFAGDLPAQAATEYELLEPIPQLLTPGQASTTNATVFLVGLFKLAIGLAGVMAVIMIIYGGVVKISIDAVSGQSKATEIISNAIWGLIFAIAAWLILYTINPKLVEIKFDIEPQELATTTIGGPGLRPGIPPPTIPGVPMTPEQIAADRAVRTELQSKGVLVNAGPCTQGQTHGCTNLNGLPESAIQGLIGLKIDCACTVRVSGGTEAGHQTHGVGRAIVDLSNEGNLRSWMTTKGFLRGGSNIAVVTLSNGRRINFVFERAGEGNSTGDHWHVNF